GGGDEDAAAGGGGADADPADLLPTDGDLCASPDDCAAGSLCDPDQSETSGTCSTTGCTVGDDSTCAADGDGVCVDFDSMTGGDDPRCLDPCDEDGDCAQGARCDETGDPQVDGTFCRHAEVGEACDSDADCGSAPWRCITEDGDGWPGGTCTLPCTGGCPTRTRCNDKFAPGDDEPFCVVRCTIAGDQCRADHACRDVGSALGAQLGCAPPP
ncbi:MAG TPA: hypothetical protein VMZ28_21810, partial [Kofleriaceae bacterium]|nr:hypothetical protein [Kofleriaceae bacterium]